MFAENLDTFLRDFGVPCSVAGRSFTGIFDTPDETMNMAGVNVLSTMYTLLVKSVDAVGITSNTVVTVNAVPYVARDAVLQDDGNFTQLALSK